MSLTEVNFAKIRFDYKPITYLGTPYTHPDKAVQVFRVNAVTLVAYEFLLKGDLVYSPITHNVPIDKLGFHGDWVKWSSFDHNMLARCQKLCVCQFDGWQDSKGLKAEMEFASAHHIPIDFYQPTKELLEKALCLSNQENDNFIQMRKVI